MAAMAARYSSLKETTGDYWKTAANYPQFAMIFIAGCLLIFLSICMLPWVVLKPTSVANLFNLGSITILISFAVLKGPKEFCIDQFLCSERKFYAIGYFVSLSLCFFFSVFMKSVIIMLLSLAVECGFLIYFLASYFPGGTEGITYMFKTAYSVIS